MQIINTIAKFTSESNSLKPEVSKSLSSSDENFTELLKSNLEENYAIADPIMETKPPNMRELMETISGKPVEELYTEPAESWKKISMQASELLYGVIGSSADTRDWRQIMASDNILKSAQEQTGKMYQPSVEILSTLDEDNNLIEQVAVIKDKENNNLRLLPHNVSLAEETLLHFGATKESIPSNLEEQINPERFNDDLFSFLKNFDGSPSSIQQVVVQSASEVIAIKISQEVPLDELAKL